MISQIINKFEILLRKRFEMSMEENRKDRVNGRWTKEEHEKFMLGLQLYGRNWKKIQALIVTRNGSQIRSHAQKFFLKLEGKKSQDHEESFENQDPAAQDASHSEMSEKSNTSAEKIPNLNSPFFWSQISEMASDPSFTLWKLIDFPGNSFESQTKPPKAPKLQVKKNQRALGNITSKIESNLNEDLGFNIFIPKNIQF